jgi:PIN domain nuclease of toxin-antitoxin system
MRFLIDTHTFIWYVQSSEQLTTSVTTIINNGRNEILLSTASIWEMAIKQSTGKLNLGLPYANFINEQMRINNIGLLQIEVAHLDVVASLPFHHRDPFDRLLVAQVLVENIPIISIDLSFDAYSIQRIR